MLAVWPPVANGSYRVDTAGSIGFFYLSIVEDVFLGADGRRHGGSLRMKRYSKWLLAFGVSFLAAGGCSSRGQEETPELVASIGERLQGTGIKAERTSFNSWNTGYNMQFTVTN